MAFKTMVFFPLTKALSTSLHKVGFPMALVAAATKTSCNTKPTVLLRVMLTATVWLRPMLVNSTTVGPPLTGVKQWVFPFVAFVSNTLNLYNQKAVHSDSLFCALRVYVPWGILPKLMRVVALFGVPAPLLPRGGLIKKPFGVEGLFFVGLSGK